SLGRGSLRCPAFMPQPCDCSSECIPVWHHFGIPIARIRVRPTSPRACRSLHAGSSATALSRRLLIYACIGKLRQQLVGLFLLPQRLLEKGDPIVQPDLGSSRPESTVT